GTATPDPSGHQQLPSRIDVCSSRRLGAWRDAIDERAELPEPDKLVLKSGKAGVETAGVRDHEDPGARDRLLLRAWPGFGDGAEVHPVQGQAHESDHRRPPGGDL